jgi:hypothetical protein
MTHPDNRNLTIKNVMRVGMWADNGRMWVVPNYFVIVEEKKK